MTSLKQVIDIQSVDHTAATTTRKEVDGNLKIVTVRGHPLTIVKIGQGLTPCHSMNIAIPLTILYFLWVSSQCLKHVLRSRSEYSQERRKGSEGTLDHWQKGSLVFAQVFDIWFLVYDLIAWFTGRSIILRYPAIKITVACKTWCKNFKPILQDFQSGLIQNQRQWSWNAIRHSKQIK